MILSAPMGATKIRRNADGGVDLAAGQQLYVKIVSLESWGVSVSGSKNFERDAFYAWLISP